MTGDDSGMIDARRKGQPVSRLVAAGDIRKHHSLPQSVHCLPDPALGRSPAAAKTQHVGAHGGSVAGEPGAGGGPPVGQNARW